MTTALILAAIATTFTTGFLLGDSRAIRRCNAMLDDHLRDLEKAILHGGTPPLGESAEPDDALTAAPTVH